MTAPALDLASSGPTPVNLPLHRTLERRAELLLATVLLGLAFVRPRGCRPTRIAWATWRRVR